MIKYALKKGLKTKVRSIVFIILFFIVSVLFIYALGDITVSRKEKVNEINKVPKNIALIEEFRVRNVDSELEDSYQQVEYLSGSFILEEDNILVDVITPGLLEIGIPVNTKLFSPYLTVEPVELLYGNLTNRRHAEYPIVIDNVSSINKFGKVNSVGQKIELWVDDEKIMFEVIGVIQETKERLERLAFGEKSGYSSDINETSLGYSRGYIFEETYNRITEKSVVRSLAIIKATNDFTYQSIEELMTIADLDSSNLLHLSYINASLLYYDEVNQQYHDALLLNSIILGALSVVLLVAYVISVIRGITKDKGDVNTYQEIGLNKVSIFKVNISYWLSLVLVGVFISIVGSFIGLFVLFGSILIDFFFTYLLIVSSVVVIFLIITVMIVLFSTLIFGNKVAINAV